MSGVEFVEDQPIVETLEPWGDGVAAKLWMESGLFYLPRGGSVFVPLRALGCAEVLAIASSQDQAIHLCREGNQLRIHGMGEPIAVPLTASVVAERGARIALSEGRLAVATDAAVAIHGGGRGWQIALLPSPWFERFVPSSLAFGRDHLWMGWRRGEGALFRMSLMEADFGEAEKLRDFSVAGIVPATDGTLWVAGGGSHRDRESAHLLRIRNGNIEPVSAYVDGTAEGSIFAGLVLSDEERPVVVDELSGIFERIGDRLLPLARGSLFIQLRPPGRRDTIHQFGAFGFFAGESEYLVGTSGLGVLRLHGKGVMQVEQILFDREERDP